MSYKSNVLLIGADPEVFCQHTGTGMFISAHDLVPGTKAMPVKVPGGAVQVDGVAAEFNVDPTDNAEEFINNINRVFKTMEGMVKAQNGNLILVAEPTAVFDRTYFESLPDEAKELGCDPDFNAWTDGKQNPMPDAARTFRTGGGHIHLGWQDPNIVFDDSAAHLYDCIEMTKQLDAVLYIPSLAWDRDRQRQMLYGKRGSFRPKPYGVEYRSLSNAWLRSPKLIEWMFGATQVAWERQEEDMHLYQLTELKTLLHREAPADEEISNYVRHLESWGVPAFPAGYLA